MYLIIMGAISETVSSLFSGLKIDRVISDILTRSRVLITPVGLILRYLERSNCGRLC
jgi:hypothetical protein